MACDSESQSALFSGLRFFLAGFDGANETQVVDDITSNEGEVAEQYDLRSTHVVVCNLLDSDPICTTARKDGKILVTDVWVTDCVESEVLCDPDNVLYKPSKDLGGIPGADKLYLCLTGYQGLERRQVMRMVDLMGARFSKPLQINCVTHLVCYKFEGEKYTIAKKMGLVLVNHFWLKDCLKAWTILPESDYALSGFEAEAMRSSENFVEDSMERDFQSTEHQQMPTASPSQQIHTRSCNNFPLQSTGIEQQSEITGSLCATDRNSISPNCHPSALEKSERLPYEIGEVEDVTVPVKMLQGIIASEVAHGNSVPDAENDETTDLYVEEENGSEHSSGSTPFRVGHEELGNLHCFKEHDPGSNASRPTDFTNNVRKRSVSDSKDFQGEFRLSEDTDSKCTETKRRRRSGEANNVPSTRTRCPLEEAKGMTNDFTAEEPGPCVDENLNQEASVLQVPVVSHATTVPEPDNFCSNLPPINGDMLGVDATSISDGDSFRKPIVGEEVLEGPQPAGAKSEDGLETAEGLAPNRKTSPAVGRPSTLAQVARSYKPTSRKKSLLKKGSAMKDQENLTPSEANQELQHKDEVKDTSRNEVQKQTEFTKPTTREPSKYCFAVGGSTEERNKLHSIIKLLGGKICRSRYQWRDDTTHVVLPGPLRRTEKLLAGAAAGRWILQPEYLEASKKAGRFLNEEAFEWHGEGTNDKGSISLQAPRKWRLYHAGRGVGPFGGLRVLFYGECITPPLDTYKRAIMAGGGQVLATTPPYSLHLEDGANFAIISPGVTKEDQYVMQFQKHGLGCVASSYFVDLVCHPASSLERHILFGTEDAVKAARSQMEAAPVPINRSKPSHSSRSLQEKQLKKNTGDTEDISCSVCGRLDGEELMLLCGDDNGAGCGTGTHTYCCTPALKEVPKDDWFCPQCRV